MTAGLLLTVPLKLVTGADLDSPLNPLENPVTGEDSPLIAASMAASICGPKVLITDSTTDSASTAEFILGRDP